VRGLGSAAAQGAFEAGDQAGVGVGLLLQGLLRRGQFFAEVGDLATVLHGAFAPAGRLVSPLGDLFAQPPVLLAEALGLLGGVYPGAVGAAPSENRGGVGGGKEAAARAVQPQHAEDLFDDVVDRFPGPFDDL